MNQIVYRLIAGHRHLNREIRRELARRSPDSFRLMHLKKERLAIKDRLFRMFPDAAEMRSAVRRVLKYARAA